MEFEERKALPRRVLVTGAAGAVGSAVCRALAARGHGVRGFDRRRAAEPQDFIQAELTDGPAVEAACRDVDTVVHLAANPSEGPYLESLVPDNLIGPWRVFEAAVLNGVSRVILASTMQVIEGIPRQPGRPLTTADGTASGNLYAATKVYAEELSRVYARRHRLSTLAVRIGWLPRGRRECGSIQGSEFAQDIYLSHADAGHFFTCAVEAARPGPGEWAVVFATSRPLHGHPVDLASAAELIGYEPRQAWPEGTEELR